jgi:hypothetical protein
VIVLADAFVWRPAKAQYNLACHKLHGVLTDKDPDGARRLLEQAAASGLDKPSKLLRSVSLAGPQRPQHQGSDSAGEPQEEEEEEEEAAR